MIKVTHLITGLGKGGAEAMLCNLIKKQSSQEFQQIVISLGASSYYENIIRQYQVPVYVFPLKKCPIRSILKIRKLLRESQVISCWMYHCCVLGYFLTLPEQHSRMIWNICHNNLNVQYDKRLTVFLAKLCAIYSEKVASIVYNGNPARESHEKIGYVSQKSVVIGTGCDMDIYYKKIEAREKVNQKFPFCRKKMILSVGRYHVIKDFPMLIKAVGILKKRREDIVLVLCGSGLSEDNSELKMVVEQNQLRLGKDIFLLGQRNDIADWMSAADLYVLHSISEAFPNVLLEAMSCEALCLATDVGPVKELLEPTEIIPVGDSRMLAEKMEDRLNLSEEMRKSIGKKNREKVYRQYEISLIVKQYENVYRSLVEV